MAKVKNAKTLEDLQIIDPNLLFTAHKTETCANKVFSMDIAA
jgi:hypothetical protein